MSNEELKQQIADAIASGKIQPTTIVFGDNVQHKIEKVEAGGIGVQVNYGVPKPQRPAAEPTKKTKQEDTFEPDYITFTKARTYDYNIVAVYQELIRQKWIADGNPDNFMALFSGKISEETITWAGKVGKDNLYALFKMMVDNSFISVPEGHSLQRIIETHFVDTNGKNIIGIDSAKPSKSALAVIDNLRQLLAARQTFDD